MTIRYLNEHHRSKYEKLCAPRPIPITIKRMGDLEKSPVANATRLGLMTLFVVREGNKMNSRQFRKRQIRGLTLNDEDAERRGQKNKEKDTKKERKNKNHRKQVTNSKSHSPSLPQPRNQQPSYPSSPPPLSPPVPKRMPRSQPRPPPDSPLIHGARSRCPARSPPKASYNMP